MGAAGWQKLGRLRRGVHTVLSGPQFAAFLPAVALVLYWYGGETVMFFFAALFPAVLAVAALVVTPRHAGRWDHDIVTGLPLEPSLLAGLGTGFDTAGVHRPNRTALVAQIDDWAIVRGRHGGKASDEILRKTADRLRDSVRPEDLVAYLGDGRFGVALKGGRRLDLEAMIQVASRIQAALGEPLAVDEARVLVTVSIGFCLPSRAPEPTGEASLKAAESALNEAQNAGPGSIRAYSRGMKPRRGSTGFVAKEVLRALDDDQIVPWFQPQISTDTGAITGFEALARWMHPDKGQIAPGAFLPAISEAGLHERLGEVMLYKSLTALGDWDRAGLEVPGVAVNLSPDELRNPKLYDKIRWELDRFDIAPERLTLEILETVVADAGDDTATRNIASLSALGCRIDLDDFGTGHASITSIRRFDVHRLKIDRSFVTHVDTDRDQQNMVAAILTMAERLGVGTLAEGVETAGEHAMLAQLGCGDVQGYSIGRPMPYQATLTWIADHRKGLPDALPSLQSRA